MDFCVVSFIPARKKGVTYTKTVECKEIGRVTRPVQSRIPGLCLLDRCCGDIYDDQFVSTKSEEYSAPNPTMRPILACFHFIKSPPFPHPKSSTFAPGP